MTLLRSPAGGDFSAATVRRRLSDARARLITNAILLGAITLAIAAVLVALGRHGG